MGGDGLTTKRGNEAKLARADAPTPEGRLEGLPLRTFDHQTMVDHDRPWSKHGRPSSCFGYDHHS